MDHTDEAEVVEGPDSALVAVACRMQSFAAGMRIQEVQVDNACSGEVSGQGMVRVGDMASKRHAVEECALDLEDREAVVHIHMAVVEHKRLVEEPARIQASRPLALLSQAGYCCVREQ